MDRVVFERWLHFEINEDIKDYEGAERNGSTFNFHHNL